MKYTIRDVTVVIPNWNGVHLMKKHLSKALDISKGAKFLVVDDASTDGSVEFLYTEYPSVSVVEKKHHSGFSGSVNLGVSKAQTDLVYLLNTDVIPEKDYLSNLLVHFDEPTVFAVASMDKSIEEGAEVLRGRGIAHWHKGFYIHSRGEVNKTDTAWVSGGSSMFRRDLWVQFGGMDLMYEPFYWEDIDLSYTARKSGYEVRFEPQSTVLHFHSEGKIMKSFSPYHIKVIAYRNQFLFVWKNLSEFKYWVAHIVWSPIHLFHALMRGDVAFLIGIFSACIRIPQACIARVRVSRYWKRSDIEMFVS